MFVEKQVCDLDSKLVMHHESLKLVRRRVDVLRQMNDAPDVYANTVVEVVRRKKFSEKFVEVRFTKKNGRSVIMNIHKLQIN